MKKCGRFTFYRYSENLLANGRKDFGGVYVRQVIVSTLALSTSWFQIFAEFTEDQYRENLKFTGFHILEEMK